MKNSNKYSKQTLTCLIIGGLLILFIVGDGLIYLIYGPFAGFSGLLCIGFGILPVFFVIGFLYLLQWIAKTSTKN